MQHTVEQLQQHDDEQEPDIGRRQQLEHDIEVDKHDEHAQEHEARRIPEDGEEAVSRHGTMASLPSAIRWSGPIRRSSCIRV